MDGYVYCISNKYMPGLVKIGYSGDVARRMKELGSCSIAVAPFICHFAKKVQNMRLAEAKLHKDMDQHRVHKKKEFFEISFEDAKAYFDSIKGEYVDVSQHNDNDDVIENPNTIVQYAGTEKEPWHEMINKIMFKCKRCGHESSTKSNLLKHLRRKNSCTPSNDKTTIDDYIKELLGTKQYNETTFNCCFCSKPFNSRQNMHRHKKTCKKAERSVKDDVNILKQTIATMNEHIKELENKITSNTSCHQEPQT